MNIKINNIEELHNRAGYDSDLKQYYIITYAWEFIVDGLKKTLPYRDIKSGITGIHETSALSGFKTRYKMYPINMLWSDRKLLPKKVKDIKQANEIVWEMDTEFKRIIEYDLVWNKRTILDDKGIGTEVYRTPKKYKKSSGLEHIKELWEYSFNHAVFSVLKEQSLSKSNGFEIMGEFNTILEELNYNIERGFKKLRIVATTGFGKGLILHMFGRHTEISKKSNILVYYANTIFNTKQLAKVHYDKYEYGGKLQNDNKKIIVCTDITKVKTRDNKYIEVYAASDNTGRLKQIIKHALLNDDRYTFYVNKASAYAFNKIINEIIDDTNYTKLILVGIDEIQDFTGRIDKTEITGAVTNPIKNSIQMGVTATEERRDDSEKNRKDIVKNNDIEYFGKLIYEIFPDDAMALKRHSPVDFVTLVLSKGNDELTNSLLKNKEIALKLGRKSESVRIRLLHNLVGIVKGINDYKKSKILDVCSYRGDVSKILECLEILQKNNIISSDFIFINGLIENRTESIDKFNHKNTKKAIVVGTSWLCVGMDAPKCDMVISVYDFGKKRFARQFVGRGTRFDGNKRCLVMVPVLSSEWKIPTLILVKEDFEKNQNSHSNTLSKVDIKTPYSGAKKPKGVTHQTVIATQCEPLDELKWNEYNLAVECNELGSFDFKKITKKYLLNGLNTYPNLEHLIKYDWNTFRRIERHQEIYDIDEILSIFPDYNSIPSDKDLFSKDIQNKSDKISKNRNLKRVYLVKLNQINKKIYEKNIN